MLGLAMGRLGSAAEDRQRHARGIEARTGASGERARPQAPHDDLGRQRTTRAASHHGARRALCARAVIPGQTRELAPHARRGPPG
jgi:hypothetical protein